MPVMEKVMNSEVYMKYLWEIVPLTRSEEVLNILQYVRSVYAQYPKGTE